MTDKPHLNLGSVSPVPQSVRLAPQPVAALATTAVAALLGDPPPREAVIDGLAPSGHVTILSGDGGTGKSLLALQAGACVSLGVPFFGREVRRGAVLYLSAEDDLAELHRRLAAIAKAEGFDLGDLPDFHLLDLAGADALLAVRGRERLEKTALFAALEVKAAELRPELIIVDTAADAFGGDENDRAEVRQFVGFLRGLARRFKCAVLLLSHPSQHGLTSRAGTSGSTAWSNSARSRLYFERVEGQDGQPADPDLRLLTVKKSNYARAGDEMRLRYVEGRFVRADGDTADAKRAAGDRAEVAEAVFLRLLDAFARQKRNASATKGTTFAPALFAPEEEAKREGIAKADLEAAMRRLFSSGKIAVEEFGSPSHRRKRLVVSTPDTAAPKAPDAEPGPNVAAEGEASTNASTKPARLH